MISDEQIRENFRHACRIARTDFGMSMSKLAGSVGVSVGAIQKFEAGKTTPALPTCLRLATELGIDLYKVTE